MRLFKLKYKDGQFFVRFRWRTLYLHSEAGKVWRTRGAITQTLSRLRREDRSYNVADWTICEYTVQLISETPVVIVQKAALEKGRAKRERQEARAKIELEKREKLKYETLKQKYEQAKKKFEP